jgi:membrane-bound metal-dependent hydrolase YbcI (DUF457 family)
MVICLQILTTFYIGIKTAFLSYWMCIVSVTLGVYKNHTPQPPPLRDRGPFVSKLLLQR